jgi:hypothetical protein
LTTPTRSRPSGIGCPTATPGRRRLAVPTAAGVSRRGRPFPYEYDLCHGCRSTPPPGRAVLRLRIDHSIQGSTFVEMIVPLPLTTYFGLWN